jgi:predicted ArsR family transcriptional regulator
VDSPAWIKQKAPSVEAANLASGLSVKPKQFEKQLEAYQEEELLRVFGAMKNVGKKPIVDYLLSYASKKENPEKRRAAALAGLENNLDRKNDAHAKAMLDLLASDDTADAIRDVAARRVGELSREQVAERLYALFDHDRWKVRWTVAGLLLKMTDTRSIDEFMARLGKIKHMAISEPLTYGPSLKNIKGDTGLLVAKYSTPEQPAPVRLTALGYYYEYGTKADLAKVEGLISDSQKVPSCAKDAEQCAWSCSVRGKDGAELKEVATIGNFVEYCLVPTMKGRLPVEPQPSEANSGKDAASGETK